MRRIPCNKTGESWALSHSRVAVAGGCCELLEASIGGEGRWLVGCRTGETGPVDRQVNGGEMEGKEQEKEGKELGWNWRWAWACVGITAH